MQNNGLDVELQRTLNELCSDLFAISALDDCNAILQSLALLAETFPQAQTLLGRLLSQNEDKHARPKYTNGSKLKLLTTNFLYWRETARSAVALLAALANDNLGNQKRIAQSVTGVKLDVDPANFHPTQGCIPVPAAPSNLFALTVPATVTSTYRRWRKRQRELQNRRLPSGSPPAHDGIPMPCYCDNCLGAEQFLSTWQQHFNDLSRWTRDSDDSRCSSFSHLSTEEFFQLFLQDHHVLKCTVVEALGNQKESEGLDFNRAYKLPGLLYYFVSPEEFTAGTSRASVQFNPLCHVSAIAISPEVDTNSSRRAERGTKNTDNPLSEPFGPTALATEQVILFTSNADIGLCDAPSLESPDSDADIFSVEVHSNEEIRADFCKLEDQHGDFVQCEPLEIDVCSEESNITAITRNVLLSMISFCERDDHIPLSVFRRSFCPPIDDEHAHEQITAPCSLGGIEIAQSMLNTRVVMTANLNLTEPVLQIDCFLGTAENRMAGLYAARISQRELINDKTGLGLLCLADEALESLLERCRVCTCGSPDIHVDSDSIIFLEPLEDKRVLPPSDNGEAGNGITSGNAVEGDASIQIPLPGLSSEATHNLARLEALVSEDNCRSLTNETLTVLMARLSRVVADCNERISYLSIAKDKALVRATREVRRTAAISRCRHCRDLLIQLGKKLALELRLLDPSSVLSRVKLSRLAKTIRTSLQNALAHSTTFDPWEIPDGRVEKLHLDHRVWASGFPDAAYYQDTDTRRRENKKKQQHLSRKLLLQQKNQSSGKTRAKQRNRT